VKRIHARLVILIVLFLIQRADGPAKPGTLRYGWSIRSLGVVSVIIWLYMIYIFGSGSYHVEKAGETISLGLLLLIFGVLGPYMVIETFLVKGQYDQESIYLFSPWHRKVPEKWIDLVSIKYCDWNGMYVLRFKSGTVLRVSQFLGGHSHIIDFLRENGHVVD